MLNGTYTNAPVAAPADSTPTPTASQDFAFTAEPTVGGDLALTVEPSVIDDLNGASIRVCMPKHTAALLRGLSRSVGCC